MLVLSQDSFFLAGITEMTNYYCSPKGHKLMILDSSVSIYIIDLDWFDRQNFKEPIFALQHCDRFLYPRNIKTNALFNAIIDSDKKNFDFPLRNITEAELNIINGILSGDRTRVISCRYNLSIKTVHAHKLNAIKKLGVKNIMMLYKLLSFWNMVWPILNNNNGTRKEISRSDLCISL